MLVVLPFCRSDAESAYDLLLWMEQLSDGTEHNLLLVADGGVEWDEAVAVLTQANRSFRHASIISTETAVTGWPQGANSLFLKAAQYCQETNQPFLWLEPDALPLSRDWLKKIQAAYKSGFLGHVYECNSPGLPRQLLSGVAVYPANAYDLIHPRIGNQPHLAWDVSAAEIIIPLAQDSTLFHHIWGEKDLPPIFVKTRNAGSPRNALTLEHIRSGAVLFHRCKDASLRRLFSPKLGIPSQDNLMVVLPICNIDSILMCKLLDWINAMGNTNGYEAMVSYDVTTIRSSIGKVIAKAGNCFGAVHQTSYSVPKGAPFPQTAAFHHAARAMSKLGRPWLWLEADCVPLKPSWLQELQREYDQCGKLFCGPVVPGRGHINGTAIYPPDTPQLMPRTMRTLTNAWDVECQDEIGPYLHDSKLWCLAWAVDGGKLSPVGGSELPSFPRGSPLLRQINRKAVIFHRDKTGSLIDRLAEQ